MKKILPFLLCLISLGFSYAQTTFQGRVTDSLDNPVPLANVYLQPAQKQVVVAYAITDNNGHYAFTYAKPGAYTLNISALGYKTQVFPVQIDSLNPEKSIVVNTVMQTQKTELAEVIVNANLPVVVKKDTISFKADAYANGTERTAEELLKKIPGLEVNSQGQISVNGKSIEKVMVDGDDLFEKGYSLLTKNLNAGVIDRVEVYEHYSDNPLLKGVEDSDNVALNLTLKEDKKQQLFGNANAGIATDEFYEHRLNLISFQKKSKHYFFGNANNTGYDPAGDLSGISGNTFTSGRRPADGHEAPNVMNLSAGRPNLKNSYINFNNAEMATLSSIFTLNEKTKLQTLGFFSGDENDFFRDQQFEFFGPGDPFVNTEDYKLRKKTKNGFFKADLTSNLSKNKLFEYSGNIRLGNQNTKTSLLFNNEPINEKLTSNPLSVDQYLSYTIKQKTNKAFIAQAHYKYDEKPINYAADTFLLGALFDKQDFKATAQQSLAISQIATAELRWITDKQKSNWEWAAGFKHISDRLGNNIFLGEEEDLQEFPFGNELNFQQQNIFLSGRYRQSFGRLKTSVKGNLHQLFTKQDDQNGVSRKNPLYWSGNFDAEYKFSNISILMATYSFNQNNAQLLQVADGFYLTDYRSLNRGFGNFQQLQNQFLFVNYAYGGYLNGFTFNTSFIYSREADYFSSKVLFDPNFTVSETALLSNRESYSFNFQSDYYIKSISNNLKSKFGYTQSRFQNFVNQSGLRDIESQNLNFGFEMRSAFLGFFNYHFGSEWQYSEIEFDGKNTRTDNLSFLDLYLNLNKSLTIKMANDRYFFGNIDGNSDFYFSEVSALYKPQKNNWDFELKAHNIFNTNNLQNSNISDSSTSTTDFRLLSRYLIFKIGFRF